ncbi:MAG TPA: protocatechuate 3,4-dioxygenase [Allosphingosinicella sp.]|jgi:protocatechuate 3,4-dioxygenase beta subunit
MAITRRAALGQITAGAGLLATGASAQTAHRTPTPFQIVGPFYPLRRPADADADLTMISGHPERAAGRPIELTGRVLTPRGQPVANAMMDVWQANAAGRYAHASDTSGLALDDDFQGFGRLWTDAEGRYRVLTVRPGAYPIGGDGSPMRTPHIHFEVSGRIDRLTTQMYFPGEALNRTDILLRDQPGAEALIARALEAGADGLTRYAWDIILASG